MVRRSNRGELNPEDFVETNEENEGPDKLMEIIRGVNEPGDDGSLAESNGVANRQSSDVRAEQADDRHRAYVDSACTVQGPRD